jgi:hypothetical protein
LETITLSVTLPSQRNGLRTALVVQGLTTTSRKPLWTMREHWTSGEVDAGLQPSDAAHHALLVALQDRPDSQSTFEACLLGKGWEDVPLPF